MTEHRSYRLRLNQHRHAILGFLGGLLALALGALLALGLFGFISPWPNVSHTFGVVLMDTGCGFSRTVAGCMKNTPRADTLATDVVQVYTDLEGPEALLACADIRRRYQERRFESLSHLFGFASTLVPESLWCRKLAGDARRWMVDQDVEIWPGFVRSGKHVGSGMYAENLASVGDPLPRRRGYRLA